MIISFPGREHRAGRFTARRVLAPMLTLVVLSQPWAFPNKTSAEDLPDEVRERVHHATVMVITAASRNERGDHRLGSGSGFFLNDTGLLITNNHVVDPTHLKSDREKQKFHYDVGRLTWQIIADSGTEAEKTWDATVLYQNEQADQALLQVFDSDGEMLSTPHFLELQPESRLAKRMQVWSLGFPGGDRQRRSREKHPTVSETFGHILDIPRTPAGRVRMIYTDVIARPGNSGGPMVDRNGFLVGTVTLMRKPQGRDDTGGANYSALVPAKLTGEFIRNAFDLGKIPPGTSVIPFVALLAQNDRLINLPEFERLNDQDVLIFSDGDRIYGDFDAETITWRAELGDNEFPTGVISYIMNSLDKAHLFLDGGNHIAADSAGYTFQFKPQGSTMGKRRYSSIAAIGFRMGHRSMQPATGELVVFDSDSCHLVLSEIEGTVPFKSKIGLTDVALPEIHQVDRIRKDRVVLTFADGRRMTGQFEKGHYQAKLAATQTPISISPRNLSQVYVDTVEAQTGTMIGLELDEALASAGRPIQRIVTKLREGETHLARAELNKFLKPAVFRRLPGFRREQVQLVEAITLLREGKPKDSLKVFRRCTRASDSKIVAFAYACKAVLANHEGFEYQGKPLTEVGVFVEAGTMLSLDYIRLARDVLANARNYEGRTHADYAKSLTTVDRQQSNLQVAAVFIGAEADDELIRLWNFATKVCRRELARIDGEIKRTNEARRRGRGQPSTAGMQLSAHAARRKLNELAEKQRKALGAYEVYQAKLWSYGFRIEDPDIQEFHEREDELPGGSGG